MATSAFDQYFEYGNIVSRNSGSRLRGMSDASQRISEAIEVRHEGRLHLSLRRTFQINSLSLVENKKRMKSGNVFECRYIIACQSYHHNLSYSALHLCCKLDLRDFLHSLETDFMFSCRQLYSDLIGTSLQNCNPSDSQNWKGALSNWVSLDNSGARIKLMLWNDTILELREVGNV